MTRKCYENVQMQIQMAEQVNKAFHMLPKFIQDKCLKERTSGRCNVDKDGLIIIDNLEDYEK